MTVDDILSIADSGYPDGAVAVHYAALKEGHRHGSRMVGDTLALAAAIELMETQGDLSEDMEGGEVSSGERLSDAISKMETFANEINGVINALSLSLNAEKAQSDERSDTA